MKNLQKSTRLLVALLLVLAVTVPADSQAAKKKPVKISKKKATLYVKEKLQLKVKNLKKAPK